MMRTSVVFIVKLLKTENLLVLASLRRIREFSPWLNTSWPPFLTESSSTPAAMMMMMTACSGLTAAPLLEQIVGQRLMILVSSPWQMIKALTLSSTLKKPVKGEF